MRNDARPVGEDAAESPIGGHETPVADRQSTDDRQRRESIVNREECDNEKVLPTNDSTLNTKI